MQQLFSVYRCMILALATGVLSIGAENALTVDRAVQKVLENNPELKAIRKSTEASSALADQERLWPNPELETSVEGMKADEIEIALTQTIELGGKRKARTEAALQNTRALQAEYDQKVLELRSETIRRFCTILSSIKKMQLLDSQISFAQQIRDAISQRVQAGASARVDAVRARMAVADLQMEKNRIDTENKQELLGLSVLLADPVSGPLAGEMAREPQLPSLQECLAELDEQPAMKMLQIQTQQLDAAVKTAKSEALPDLEITAGYIRNNALDENSPLIAAGIELPIFNRNRGSVVALQREKSSHESVIQQRYNVLEAEVKQLYQQIIQLNAGRNTLINELIPGAEDVYKELYGMYQKGRVSFIEVIEAQTELIEHQNALVELELDRALLCIDLSELCGIECTIIQ